MTSALLTPMLSALRATPAEVRAAYRVGSRVYGTAGPLSDEDFVVVLSRAGQKQDLAFGEGINIVVHGVETFQSALEQQSVFALECYFAPLESVLVAPRPAFRWALDKKKLAASATEKSKSDWQKAKKLFLEEPQPSRKKLFHSLRVPAFALQIMKTGKLSDFSCANAWFHEMMQGPDDSFDWYEERFGKMREQLCAALVSTRDKRG